jgi:CBS domain-containing protein
MTLREVAVVLDRYAVGVAVVRTGDGAGVVSERDLVTAIAAGGDPDQLWGGDVMTPELVTVTPATTILAAAGRMLDAGVRHVAVVDGDDIVGVVSMRDVLEVLLDQTSL